MQATRCTDHSTRIIGPTATASISPRTTACVRLLAPVIDALVVVQAVQRAEHLVAEIAHGIVQRLQMLLLLVPFQGQLRAEQLSADVAPVTGSEGQRQ